jgi:hypothetical protein
MIDSTRYMKLIRALEEIDRASRNGESAQSLGEIAGAALAEDQHKSWIAARRPAQSTPANR